MLLTDMEVCLPTLRKNVVQNFPKAMGNVCVIPYAWGESTTRLKNPQEKFDIIILANVLYSEADSRLLAQSTVHLLSEGEIMFISMGRNCNGETAFIKNRDKHGYSTTEVSVFQAIIDLS